MVNLALTSYISRESYLQRVKGLSKEEAKEQVDVAMHEARLIFETLVCQFYIRKAMEYLEPESAATPLDHATPFGDGSLKLLCGNIFEKVQNSVQEADIGGFVPSAWFRNAHNGNLQALNTKACHDQAAKDARDELLDGPNNALERLKAFPAFILLCTVDRHNPTPGVEIQLADSRYDLRALMDVHFKHLVSKHPSAPQRGSPSAEGQQPANTASSYLSTGPSATPFSAYSSADFEQFHQVTGSVGQERSLGFTNSIHNWTALDHWSVGPPSELAASVQTYPGMLLVSDTWHPPDAQTPNFDGYNAQGYTEWNDREAAPVDLYRPPGNIPLMLPVGNQGFNEFNALDLGPNSDMQPSVNRGAMTISFQEPAYNGYHQMAAYTQVPVGNLALNTFPQDQPAPRVAPDGTFNWEGSVYEQETRDDTLVYRDTPFQANLYPLWEGQQQPDMWSPGSKQRSYELDPEGLDQEMPSYPFSDQPLGYWPQEPAPDYTVYDSSQFKTEDDGLTQCGLKQGMQMDGYGSTYLSHSIPSVGAIPDSTVSPSGRSGSYDKIFKTEYDARFEPMFQTFDNGYRESSGI